MTGRFGAAMPTKPEGSARAQHNAAYKNIFAQKSAVADTIRGLAWLPAWEQAGGDPKLLSPIWTWATRAEMTTLFDRARQWGEELNREWLAKGIARGERALIRRLVARQFGSEAADELAPVLDGISDSDRLTAIAAEVFSCGTVEELVDRAQNA